MQIKSIRSTKLCPLETDLFYNLQMQLLYHVLQDIMDENQYMNIG